MDTIVMIVIGFFVLCAISAFVVLCCVILSSNTRTNEDGEWLSDEEVAELEYSPYEGEVFWRK